MSGIWLPKSSMPRGSWIDTIPRLSLRNFVIHAVPVRPAVIENINLLIRMGHSTTMASNDKLSSLSGFFCIQSPRLTSLVGMLRHFNDSSQGSRGTHYWLASCFKYFTFKQPEFSEQYVRVRTQLLDRQCFQQHGRVNKAFPICCAVGFATTTQLLGSQ